MGILDTIELVDVLTGVIIVQNDVLYKRILIEMDLVLAKYAKFLRRNQYWDILALD